MNCLHADRIMVGVAFLWERLEYYIGNFYAGAEMWSGQIAADPFTGVEVSVLGHRGILRRFGLFTVVLEPFGYLNEYDQPAHRVYIPNMLFICAVKQVYPKIISTAEHERFEF